MEKLKESKWIQTYPFIGFLLMIMGPVLLGVFGLVMYSRVPRLLALIVSVICFFLPGIGAVIGTFYLEWSKNKGLLGKALVVVTIIMCNPIFYFLYFVICILMGNAMAGIPLM